MVYISLFRKGRRKMYFVYHMFQVWLFCKAEICVITKTKIQASTCLQLARFTSDPPTGN